MQFKAEVKVTLKRGVLDPQGVAVEGALRSMGYAGVEGVRVGKLVELWVQAASEAEASRLVEEASRRLLANPVLESYTFTLAPAEDVGAKGAPTVAAGTGVEG